MHIIIISPLKLPSTFIYMIERHKKHHDTPLLLFQLLQPITLHISLETSHFTDYTTYRTEDTHTHTRHHTECLLWITLWLVLKTSFHSPTTTLDSSIITQHCTHNTSPSIIHTIHYCMALSLHTPSSTAPHSTQTQSLSAPHLSWYTITDNSTLYIKHTQYTIHYMAFWVCSTLLPYWIGCLFEHTPYSSFHLSMTFSSLFPGYHSIIENAQDCTPYHTWYVFNLANHTNTAGAWHCMPDWSHTLLRTDQVL